MLKKLLGKELKLSASTLTYCFIAFGFMTLIPGYPILVGVFFITLGIFYTFQDGLINNDIIYTALLPVAKKDVVGAKFIFACFIEICGFVLMLILTLLRMTVFKDAVVYRQNFMMNANLVSLGFALLVFAAFNFVFIRGFFKNEFRPTKPFILYTIVGFLVITVAETLHHIPGIEEVNAFGFDCLLLQLSIYISGLIMYILITYAAFRESVEYFEKLDI